MATLCGVAIASLGAAYAVLAFEHRTPLLLNVVVHEDGRRTLLETILYFEHFLREVPVEIAIAWAAALAFSASAPPPADPRRSRNRALVAGALALVIAASSYAAAAARSGAWSASLDLLQFRTRDDQVAFGSHWHSHLHHVVAMAVTAAGLAGVYRWTAGTDAADRSSARRWCAWAAAVGGVTLALRPGGVDWNGTRLVGHALREVVTHAAVTLPLTFAALLAAEGAPSVSARTARRPASLRRGLALLAVAAAFPLALLAQLSGRDVLAAARKQASPWDLLSSHAFEHLLDYAFAALVAVVVYEALRLRDAAGHGRALTGGAAAL